MFVLPVFGCVGEARILETDELTLEMQEAQRLHIDVGAGDLLVEGVEGLDRVELVYELTTERNVFAEDDAAQEALEVVLATDASGDLTALVELDDAPAGYYVNVRMRAPSHLALTVEDSSGDTWIRDFAALDLQDESGDVEVERIAGAVTIDDGSGALSLDSVGPTSIEDASGDMRVREVSGPLDIDADSGDIDVSRVSGSISVLDTSGDMDVTDGGADLNIMDGSGRITVDAISGRVSIRDGSGDIVVGQVGELDIISNGSGQLRRR